MKGEIRQYLFQGLQKLCKNGRVIILIDALDEAGEQQAIVIFKDLETLVNSLRDDSACHVSLCVACRHYPDIRPKTCKTIVMEDLNSSDIEYVVNSRLSSDGVFDHSEKQRLKTKILGKSEGVFQWTSLATETVIRTRKKGDPFQAALRNLDRIPKDLNLLYKALLRPEDEDEHELKQRTRLFQWVALAAEPLTPRALQHALALRSEMTYRFVCEYEQSDTFNEEQNFETKVRNLSKGLIQIKGSFQNGWTEFIHHSILEFLLGSQGLELLSGSPGSDPIGLGHFEISMSCLKYLFIEDIRRSIPKSVYDIRPSLKAQDWIDQFPVISYAWNNWIFHAVSGNNLADDKNRETFGTNLTKTFCWPEDQPIINFRIIFKVVFGSPLHSWARKFRPSLDFNGRINLKQPSIPEWKFHLHGLIPDWPCNDAKLIHLLALTGLLAEGTLRAMSSDLESTAAPRRESLVTPLCYAVFGRQKKVVQGLIAARVRVQYNTGLFGRLPLYLASLWGDKEVISLLLKHGSKIDHREGNSWTPLHAAVKAGNIAAMDILINAGAKINCQSMPLRPRNPESHFDTGVSPLHVAAFYGKLEAMKQLILKRADLNLKSLGRKEPPLFSAILARNIDAIRLLRKLGADFHARNAAGDSPIHQAFYVRDITEVVTWTVDIRPARAFRIFELLIQFGCNVNAKNKLGLTPLHLSAYARMNTEIMSLLLRHGADPHSTTRHGYAPIHSAAQHDKDGTQALLHAGANIHAESRGPCPADRGFPIHLAVYASGVRQVQLLIKEGSNVNAVNCKGDTPLRLAFESWAQGKYSFLVFPLLLRAGTDPKIVRNEIYTTCRLVRVLEILLKAGLDPNTRDDEGETALFWVVRSRKLSRREEEQQKMDGVELLLRSGADPSITNQIGRTALSYAIRNGDSRVARLLRASGSPEGVWRRYSKFPFVAKRVDELTGKLSRVLIRDRSWYPDVARNIVRLLFHWKSAIFGSSVDDWQYDWPLFGEPSNLSKDIASSGFTASADR